MEQNMQKMTETKSMKLAKYGEMRRVWHEKMAELAEEEPAEDCRAQMRECMRKIFKCGSCRDMADALCIWNSFAFADNMIQHELE